MEETIKINLTKIGVMLVIVLTLCSVVGGGYIAYDNAKTAKVASAENARKIGVIETNQARFEGVIDERTKNTQKRVDDIYDIVKEWKPE